LLSLVLAVYPLEETSVSSVSSSSSSSSTSSSSSIPAGVISTPPTEVGTTVSSRIFCPLVAQTETNGPITDSTTAETNGPTISASTTSAPTASAPTTSAPTATSTPALIACPAIYAPVCGYYTDCVVNDDCSQTFWNDCNACSDPGVIYHISGECPPPPPEKTYCVVPPVVPIYNNVPTNVPPTATTVASAGAPTTSASTASAPTENVPTASAPTTTSVQPGGPIIISPPIYVCPDIYSPVCGYLTNCVGSDCSQTYSNDCYACIDNNVDYHIPGEC